MKTRVTLKVRAGAPKTSFVGRYGEGWKLQVAAPPVDGKANEAIQRFLAKLCGVPAGSVRLVTGASATTKTLEIEGISAEGLERAILESDGSRPNSGSA